MTAWTDDGQPAVWVTEVEPEFDAGERDAWQALAEYRAAICPQCGNLKAICSDPDGIDGNGHYPQLDVCWVTATREVATRRWRDKHEKPNSDRSGFLPTDGAIVWASPVDYAPGEDFLS